MSTTTITGTKPAETLTLPVNDQPRYTKVPGGYEVEFKGYKWFTGTIPNEDFVPPKDFKISPMSQEVPINPNGQTELPQKLNADYTNVRLYPPSSFLFSHLNLRIVQIRALFGPHHSHQGGSV
jgi:hypothetical protein